MTQRTEIEESWDTLESFGFPPEACGWPHTDITGLLPEAIECALKCLIQQREDLAAELVKLRAVGEDAGGKPE